MTCKRKYWAYNVSFSSHICSECHSDQCWVRDTQERCVQFRQWMPHRALNSYTRCQCQSCVCQKQLVKSSLVMRILIRYPVTWCTVSAHDTSNCIILVICWRIKNLVPNLQMTTCYCCSERKNSILGVIWTAHIHSVGKMLNFVMLQQLVHIVTTVPFKAQLHLEDYKYMSN